MRRLFFALTCCLFTGQATYASELNEMSPDLNANVLRSSCTRIPKSKIIFQAQLDECRIGLNDRELLAEGADFVTAFNGNDFSCRTLRKGGIEITPANGRSFTIGIPPLGGNGPVPFGLFDHVKFLAYSLFREAPLDESLVSTWVGTGRQLNVENNPFGLAVPNPNNDARLACFGFVSLDPTLLTTFDWICTNDVIYALVERLPGGEEAFGNYAAYTYMIPVLQRRACDRLKDVHTFQTVYNRAEGTVTFRLDGKNVFEITQIGRRLTEENAFVFKNGKRAPLENPSNFKVLDHGGVDQDIRPTGLQTGLSFFTLLDFYPPNPSLKLSAEDRINPLTYRGLVRLESSLLRNPTTFFYNNPLFGGPAEFVIDSVLDPNTLQYLPLIPSSYRLFGQGAKIRLYDYVISTE